MKNKKRKIVVKLIAWITSIAMALCIVPVGGYVAEAAPAIKNPVTVNNGDGSITSVWDCVYFGHYPQSSDGSGGFVKDPIKWRVLSVDGNEALLLADKNLDVLPYNVESMDITWGDSTLRSWLNGYDNNVNTCGKDYTSDNFLDIAFTSSEQAAINPTTLEIGDDNPSYEVENLSINGDKVRLLSISEATNPDYGFDLHKSGTWGVRYNSTRIAKNTEYVASDDKMTGADMPDRWWLCTQGVDIDSSCFVYEDGYICTEGDQVSNSALGVRPALYLNISLPVWSYAGTVCSDGTENEPIDISKCVIGNIPAKTYNGEPLMPALTVKDGGKTLVKDTDYTVKYSNNINAGTAKVTVTGKGNYKGTVTKTFTINKAKITSAALSAASYTYDGKVKTPAVTVKSGSKVLADKLKKSYTNSNIKLTYPSGRKKPGTYKVKVTGKGNYTGTVTKTFKINVKPVSISKLSKGKKSFTVKWKKQSSKYVTGYQVRYSLKSNMKSAKTSTVKSYKTTGKTIKKLKSKKYYYVQVRTYKKIDSKKYYSAWSGVKKVKTK